MNCDICGQNTTLPSGRNIIGLSIQLTTEAMSKEDVVFLRNYLAPYKANRSYKICVACWLKVLGVKVK